MSGKSQAVQQAEFDLSQLVGNKIGVRIQVGGLAYVKTCYLLSTLIPDNLQSSLNGSDSIQRIYNNTLKGRTGGPAKLWYVLQEIGFSPDSDLDKLKKFVLKEHVISKERLPRLHLRKLLLNVASALATDSDQASNLISSVGSAFMQPPVLLENLVPNPVAVRDYTLPLIKFFEKAEQQLLVTPTDLSNLRDWLKNAGYRAVVKKYRLDQDHPLEMEEIIIPSGCAPPPYQGEHPPPYLGERPRVDSVEEENKPGKGEDELVNGGKPSLVTRDSMEEQQTPSKEESKLVNAGTGEQINC